MSFELIPIKFQKLQIMMVLISLNCFQEFEQNDQRLISKLGLHHVQMQYLSKDHLQLS